MSDQQKAELVKTANRVDVHIKLGEDYLERAETASSNTFAPNERASALAGIATAHFAAASAYAALIATAAALVDVELPGDKPAPAPKGKGN
jgi:hypothetical protein